MIVGPQPASGKFLDFVERFKEVVRQPIVAHGPVVTLDVGILLRLAWLDEINTDAASSGGKAPRRMGAMVESRRAGRSSPGSTKPTTELLQRITVSSCTLCFVECSIGMLK